MWGQALSAVPKKGEKHRYGNQCFWFGKSLVSAMHRGFRLSTCRDGNLEQCNFSGEAGERYIIETGIFFDMIDVNRILLLVGFDFYFYNN